LEVLDLDAQLHPRGIALPRQRGREAGVVALSADRERVFFFDDEDRALIRRPLPHLAQQSACLAIFTRRDHPSNEEG